jgi:hypothetical protein
MIQEEIYKGIWSLAESNEGHPGTLTFNPIDGAQLEIHGQFRPEPSYSTIDVIVGQTTNGWITLLDTHFRGSVGSNITRTSVTKYAPSFIFEGHRFGSKESLRFQSVKFSLFNLVEWLDPKSIAEDSSLDLFTLKYVPPAAFSFKCFDGCTGKIESSLDRQYQNRWSDIRLKQKAHITLTYDDRKHYSDILADIFSFVRLLTLCTYEQSYPTEIELHDETLIEEYQIGKLTRQLPKTIRLIYQNSFYKPTYKTRNSYAHLLRYEFITPNFGEIIEAWFEQSKKLEQPIELLLRSLIDKYSFSIDKFMDIVKALELYHRITHPSELLPKEDFKCRKKKFLLKDLSREERIWILHMMEHGNEPTLAQRLRDMMITYAFPYFDSRVKDRDLLCRQATDNRNYYTHFNPRLRKKALNGKDLFNLMENLKLILVSAIFRSMGIPIETIKQTVPGLIY